MPFTRCNHFFAALTTLALAAGAQAPLGPPAPATSQPQATTGGPVTVDPLAPNPLAPVRLNRSAEQVLTPRIRNITRVANLVPHILSGVGLVTGLPQTGSSDKGTRQAILNYIKRHDLNLTISDVVGGTTALVAVTAELPPFAKVGMKLDVKVSALSDAKSLRAGELQLCELRGVDAVTYAVAHGTLHASGFTAQAQNASVQKNPNASADLTNGGEVVREENSSYFSESGALELRLLNPSPFNAESVRKGIATALAGMDCAVSAVDAAMVRIMMPEAQRTGANALRVLSIIGDVRVAVENPAKVTIDPVSGTVLAGEGVMISPCVVGVSELTIAIVEEDFVSQPNALAQGSTERVGRSRVEAETNSSGLQPIGGGGATVADLLQNLKTLGLTPPQLVQVFIALDKGGFLHAELEVN